MNTLKFCTATFSLNFYFQCMMSSSTPYGACPVSVVCADVISSGISAIAVLSSFSILFFVMLVILSYKYLRVFSSNRVHPAAEDTAWSTIKPKSKRQCHVTSNEEEKLEVTESKIDIYLLWYSKEHEFSSWVSMDMSGWYVVTTYRFFCVISIFKRTRLWWKYNA